MFPDSEDFIEIIGEVPNVFIDIDELKITLAIRNLIDNAKKYAFTNQKINYFSK